MVRMVLAASLALGIIVGCSDHEPESTAFEPAPCEVGIYASGERGQFITITERGEGFRAVRSDGISRLVGESVECSSDMLRADDSLWISQPFTVTETRFEADGAVLAGHLLEPAGADASTPLIVYAHGSEPTGWMNVMPDPYQMVGRGISAFVYDKRGTGASKGTYSQNFPQLADDLVAASAEAKRLAGDRYGRFGLVGLSQGGWIAPLAAKRAGADFIGIGYGLVVDIREEDAAQVELELRDAGYGDDVITKAKEITDATGLVAATSYKEGLEELDRLKEAYGDEPWYSTIKGGFTGVILSIPTETLRTEGIPMYDQLNIDWTLDPLEVLRAVEVPQFWAIAGEDREAPIGKTIARLQGLQDAGSDITILVFPGADHGMWVPTDPGIDGVRERIAEGHYDAMADWAHGRLGSSYGDAAPPVR
ncbi:MAG: alpha/beta hydrolase [Pseudomonadota bacterium]